MKDLKENPEAAAFYNKFAEEYYGNTFRKRKKSHNQLHTKDSGLKKQVFDQYNARGRDMFGQYFYHYSGLTDDSPWNPPVGSEDSMIDYLDTTRKIERKLKKKERP
jgi:hypothetical protein